MYIHMCILIHSHPYLFLHPFTYLPTHSFSVTTKEETPVGGETDLKSDQPETAHGTLTSGM